MRNLVVDRARRRLAAKRGGDRQRVTLDFDLPDGERQTIDVLASTRA